MTDVALHFDLGTLAGDLEIVAGDLATDDGLRTAVIISLFTDALARVDDPLPDAGQAGAGGDRRGWWGDALNDDPQDRIGSRLWLLERARLTDDTALKAREYCREALAWMVADGIAGSVNVETAIRRPDAARPSGALAIAITIARPTGRDRQRFDFVWDATAGSIA